MQTRQGFRQPLIIASQASKPSRPSKSPFHDPAAGPQDKAPLGFGQLDDFQANPVPLSRLSGGLAGIALIHVREFNVMAGHLLEGLSQDFHLRPVLDIRRRHVEGQQVTQGIDGDMDLRSLPTLGPVVAGPRPTFRSGLQGAAIQNGGGGPFSD